MRIVEVYNILPAVVGDDVHDSTMVVRSHAHSVIDQTRSRRDDLNKQIELYSKSL